MRLKIRPVLNVSLSQAFRYQGFYGPADQLLGVVPKQVFGLRVDEENLTVRIGDDHRIRNSLEEASDRIATACKQGLGRHFSFRHIASNLASASTCIKRWDLQDKTCAMLHHR